MDVNLLDCNMKAIAVKAKTLKDLNQAASERLQGCVKEMGHMIGEATDLDAATQKAMRADLGNWKETLGLWSAMGQEVTEMDAAWPNWGILE